MRRRGALMYALERCSEGWRGGACLKNTLHTYFYCDFDVKFEVSFEKDPKNKESGHLCTYILLPILGEKYNQKNFLSGLSL
jgi:hypothetical protein